MKSFLFLFSIVFINSLGNISADTLIRYDDLRFKDINERSAFDRYLKHRNDCINLFISPYTSDKPDYEKIVKRIDECIASLKTEIASKPDNKKVKIIYNTIQSKFLKVFSYQNSFPDIFSKGEYNCVSGTALYSIVLEKLGIPYHIKESPQHVYLEVYPNTEKILLESTSPEKGYYKFSDGFINSYVDNLVKSEVISHEEADTSSRINLFNRHYFASENISIVRLAGLQFSNYGIYHLEKKEMKEAVDEFCKANFLYECERNKLLLKYALAMQLKSNDYRDMNQVDFLALLYRYNNFNDAEVTTEAIRDEFFRVTQSQLIDNSAFERYDSSFNILKSSLTDTASINAISFIYHYELGRLGYLNSKDSGYVIKHLKAAYDLNSQQANLRTMILGYFATRVDKNENPDQILSFLNNYSNRFDFLKENKTFNSIKANCFLELSYRNYAMNDLQKGEGMLKEYELLNESLPGLEPERIYIEKAYTTAAGIYYKKGNSAKSKQILKSGLIHAPDSFKIKQMLSQF